jgi:hypothetical protein
MSMAGNQAVRPAWYNAIVPVESDFPNFRRCTYCAELVPNGEPVDWEHVLPKSFYSSTPLPKNFEKPQVPSCQPCNRRLGALEDRVRLRLGSALPADGSPARKGIFAATVKSIRQTMPGSLGLTKQQQKSNKAKMRTAEALRYALTVVAPSEVGKPSVLGGPFTPPLVIENRGVAAFGHPAIEIDPEDTIAFGQKLVRGFTRFHWKSILDKEQVIDVQVVQDEEDQKKIIKLLQGGTLPVWGGVIGSGSLEYALAGYPQMPSATISCFILWRYYWLLAKALVPGMPGHPDTPPAST